MSVTGPTRTGPATAPTAEGIAAGARKAAGRGLPPVEDWHPPHCGDLDMEIRRDGTWFYQGTPIGRPGLVKLFASILRLDPEGYVLVTPVEKVGIRVEDAPFVAVDVEREGDALRFVTNLGDETVAGPDMPIRVTLDPDTGEPAPYVRVRRNLDALIDRKSFYRLVEMGETARHEGEEWFGVRSRGAFFPMTRAAEMG
ncbi:MAG: DUF1285 domain-containing protein [Paracoccaceae bacterium]